MFAPRLGGAFSFAGPFVARFMGATVELPVALHAGRAEASGLDLSALLRRALPDGSARLFARPEDIIPLPEAGAPWRITSRISNGANLRLVLHHDGVGEAEADVPRRAVAADALTKGATVRLRVEAGAVFPAGRATAETPSQKISVPSSKEKTR